MELLQEIASWALLVLGSLFAVIGGIGVLRLPDVFSRMHGSGITDTLGAGLVLVGLMVHAGFDPVTFKLAFVLFFLFVSSPAATHALAKAALADGLKPQVTEKEPR